ncbi:sialate O-acetylesterase [Nitrospirillum amazonense]|uniref:sialate O-acetylesterase n=1 Tax=Nitrospirillum amazonense TaxID=28077 RepID=UPI00241252A7|nr:sialate O-acetylesterase [Nitrospirillum amazonense]MDG3442481.1 sialate O-acetylesterase [Nitrospirillum amazonense]
MTQYNTGTITITSGSATVTGTGTAWLTNLQPGAMLVVGEDDPVAFVAAVTADGTLTLETPWPGVSYVNTPYEAVRDFDPQTGAPLLSHGTQYPNAVINRAINLLGAHTNTAVQVNTQYQLAQQAATNAQTAADIALAAPAAGPTYQQQLDVIHQQSGYRDRLTGLPWAITDMAGRAAAWMRPDAILGLLGLLLQSVYRDHYTGGRVPVIGDATGQPLVWAQADGTLEIPALAMSGTVYRDRYPDGRVPLAGDAAGRPVLWALPTGAVEAAEVAVGTPLSRDRHVGGRTPIAVDATGRQLLGATLDGAVAADEIELGPARPIYRDRRPGGVTPVLTDAHGAGLLGLTPDGLLAGGALMAPLTKLRGAYNVVSLPTLTGKFTVAQVQEADGWLSLLIQPTAGTGTMAVPLTSAPIDGEIWYGQSNAGNPGVELALMTSALFPTHVYTFKETAVAWGTTPPGQLTDFAPLSDGAGAPNFGATLYGFAMEQRDRDAGRQRNGRLVFTVSYGGEPISYFVKGTSTYASVLASVTAAVAVAAQYGRTYRCSRIIWVQGESGPYDYTTYKTALAGIIDNLTADVMAITGQATAPLFVIVGTNRYDTLAPPVTGTFLDGVREAQIDLAADRAGTGVIYAGSMYSMPVQADGIHVTTLGRMMLGEMIAAAVEGGAAFTGLKMTSVAISGATLTVSFSIPPDGGALQFDPGPSAGGWVQPTSWYGFYFRDLVGAVAISSVAISATNTVTITLSGAPAGAWELWYAEGPDPVTTQDGWPGARGQLMSRTSRWSTYSRLGYGVPKRFAYYANPFRYQHS